MSLLRRAGGALVLPLVLAAGSGAAAPDRLDIGLAAAMESALAGSGRLRVAERDLAAARDRARVLAGGMFPRLSLDATYRYVTEVPSLQMDPARPPVAFGDNTNYSVGPAVNWVVWDWGALHNVSRGAAEAAGAREAELEVTRRQVTLAVSLAYFRAQMAAAQARLLAGSLKLAQDQHGDISRRLKAGSSSTLDRLLAHQEVLARRRQFAAARTELGSALKDLLALTGDRSGPDTSAPVGEADGSPLPADVSPASVTVRLDEMDEAMALLASAESGGSGAGHPAVRVHERAAASSRRAARAVLASRLPRVAVSGRSSLDYPNGPVLEEVHQNAVVVSASLPLFEGGRLSREQREHETRAGAAEERARQAADDLARDRLKARDALTGLKVQLEVGNESARETAEVARLTYEAYQAGQVRFTDVQAANLRALEANVQVAKVKSDMLVQLAVLRSLEGS